MDFEFLSKTLLFQGSTAKEIESILTCLGANQKQFQKDTIIYHAGESTQSLGLVLSGRVQIENDDIWGNKSVLASLGPGSCFAETYACIPEKPLMVSVLAAATSEILFLNVNKLMQTCTNACAYHNQLIRNLFVLTAQKNLSLSQRIFHTSSKSIRGRVLSYLSSQAAYYKSCNFTIPFNRQQLADYLSVDRSALSNELSRMKREGLIEVNKNHFFLKSVDAH